MSIVAVYDPKTKRIVEKLHAFPSYRSSKGITIVPKNAQEEAQLECIEKNGRLIDKLNAEIQEMDRLIALKSILEAETLQKKRRTLAEEIQRKENYAQTVMKVHALRTRITDVETITLTITTNGEPVVEQFSTDEYTGGRLSMLNSRLDDLSKTFLSDEPEFVKHTMQKLVQMEEELEVLLEQARNSYLQYIARMELADGVVQLLYKSGWNIRVEDTGSLDREVRVLLMTAGGACAELLFQPDDQIRLNTPGFSEGERKLLQEQIFTALKACGASDVEHRCLDTQQKVTEAVQNRKTQLQQMQERQVLR